MNINELVAGGGVVIVIMTLIQVTPIKLDPWSTIARIIGRAINGDSSMLIRKALPVPIFLFLARSAGSA